MKTEQRRAFAALIPFVVAASLALPGCLGGVQLKLSLIHI